jgi:hypothetical protein
MEVHIGARGDRGAIERSGLIVPAAERICNLFVDPVPDSLDDFGFDHIAGRVDCHLDDDVADDVARKRSTVDGRVGGNDRICDVHFMAADRSIDHGAEWRAGVGVMVASVCIGDGRSRLGLWSRFRGLWLRKRPLPAGLPREQEFGCVRRRVIVRVRWKVDQFVGMGAVAVGEPSGAYVDGLGTVEHDYGQQRQMRRNRQNDGSMAMESRSHGPWVRGLKTSKHGNP